MSATGKFVWYDLMTPDLAGAKAFYSSVVGWEINDSGMEGPPYLILSINGTMVGGMMELSPEHASKGARPCWNGYIGVPDVDAATVSVGEAGGKIYSPPRDIPGVGRFSVVTDPHGGGFFLFTPDASYTGSGGAGAGLGHVGWHELHAGDLNADFAFYQEQFGWTQVHEMDMGEMGMYRMFATGGDAAVGGMMTKNAQAPMPFWLYYFYVDAIDAAVERVKAGGGALYGEPHEVPGGEWIVRGRDPQGASFALVAKQR